MKAFSIPLRMTFGNPLRRPPQETPSGELLVSTSGESLLTPSKEPLRRAFVDSLRRIVNANFYLRRPHRRTFIESLRRPPQETPSGDPLRRPPHESVWYSPQESLW